MKNKQLIHKIKSAINNAETMIRENKVTMHDYLKKYHKYAEIEEKLKFKHKILNETLELIVSQNPPPPGPPVENPGVNRDEDIYTIDEE